MEVGDVVEVHCWSSAWDSVVGIVIDISEFVFIRPVILPRTISAQWPQYHERAGFYESNLKVLGHIDVAPQGEERCAEGT